MGYAGCGAMKPATDCRRRLRVMGGQPRMAEASPRVKARIAGACWLMTIVTGMVAMFAGGQASTAANLLATAFYLGATVLVYHLLKPVLRPSLSCGRLPDLPVHVPAANTGCAARFWWRGMADVSFTNARGESVAIRDTSGSPR